MSNTNWVRYIDRGFTQIRNSIVSNLKSRVPEVTDYSPSNFLIILIEIFSGLTSQLHYYIDNIANEMFLTSARRFSSLVKLSRLVDYRIKANIPSTVSVVITSDSPLQTSYRIGLGQSFSDSSGNRFVTIQNYTWNAGTDSIEVQAYEQNFVENEVIGVTNGNASQTIALPKNYVHNSLLVKIGNQVWSLVDTLGRSKSTDKVFIVDISTEKIPYIQFGDDLNGAIPPSNQQVVVSYYTTKGSKGNIGENSITSMDPVIAPDGINTITISNPEASSGGTDVESLESLRKRIPLHVRTLDRAVTKQDYQDLTELQPGVEHAAVQHDCGKTVNIYIAPTGGGIAQPGLISIVKDELEKKKTITTQLNILPAGVSYIIVDITVTAKFRNSKGSTLSDIEAALSNEYNYENSAINRPLRESDIIALIDNLDKVDFLKLDRLAVNPYPRPMNGASSLLWQPIIKSPTAKAEWRVDINATGYQVTRNGTLMGNFNYSQAFNSQNNEISFKVFQSGLYQVGHYWTFTTYPVNQDILVDDYSVPVIDLGNSNILVIEQN